MLLITNAVSNQTITYFGKRFSLHENVGLELTLFVG